MLVLQVPPNSIIDKCKQKIPAGQTLYRTLFFLDIYGKDMPKKQENLITFLEMTRNGGKMLGHFHH